MNFIKRRLCERSTYAHLVTCGTAIAAVAFGLPMWILWGMIGLSVLGAVMPDGRVRHGK